MHVPADVPFHAELSRLKTVAAGLACLHWVSGKAEQAACCWSPLLLLTHKNGKYEEDDSDAVKT